MVKISILKTLQFFILSVFLSVSVFSNYLVVTYASESVNNNKDIVEVLNIDNIVKSDMTESENMSEKRNEEMLEEYSEIKDTDTDDKNVSKKSIVDNKKDNKNFVLKEEVKEDIIEIKVINNKEQLEENIDVAVEKIENQEIDKENKNDIVNDKSKKEESKNDSKSGDEKDVKNDSIKEEKNNEYIEIISIMIGDDDSVKNDAVLIKNSSNNDIILDGWYLRKRTKLQNGDEDKLSTSIKIYTFGDGDSINAGEVLMWARNGGRFVKNADFVSSGSLSKDNSIVLLDNNKLFVDGFAWGSGHSSPFGIDIIKNPVDDEYIVHTITKTILKKQCEHDLFRINPCPIPYAGAKIIINELLPNPSGEESEDEYIELYNPSTVDISLYGWYLRDASATGKYVFPVGSRIKSKGFFVVKRSVFGFSLNNSNEVAQLFAPHPDGAVLVDRVSYTKSAPEDVSFNRDDSGLYRWSTHLTPHAQNILNRMPVIDNMKYDKKIYKGVRTDFRAEAHDPDGGMLKYRWDFGDEHKSYKANTTHVYKEDGEYTVSLRVQDDSEEVVQIFQVRVEKYPRKHRVKIIEIAPNPDGKDVGEEYIIIKNVSDDDIDMRKWSIATGSEEKKLVNHPMRKDFVLKSGEEKKIRSKYSAITLPNKGCFIEVRRPDGSVSHDKSYIIPSGYKSIPAEAHYVKFDNADGKSWQWDLSDVAKKKKKLKTKKENLDLVAIDALVSTAWRNEFGANDSNVQDISSVRGMSIERFQIKYAQFYNIGQRINTFFAQFFVKSDDKVIITGAQQNYIFSTDSLLPEYLPSPEIVALSLAQISDSSIEDIIAMFNESL